MIFFFYLIAWRLRWKQCENVGQDVRNRLLEVKSQYCEKIIFRNNFEAAIKQYCELNIWFWLRMLRIYAWMFLASHTPTHLYTHYRFLMSIFILSNFQCFRQMKGWLKGLSKGSAYWIFPERIFRYVKNGLHRRSESQEAYREVFKRI